MSKLDYTIKLVYPDWVVDNLRDKRMGFSGKYKNYSFPIGAKMLVYLTEQQMIMGINTVKGNWKDGEIYPSGSGYPINLPVVMDYEVPKDGIGLTLKEVKNIVDYFQPRKDLSFFPLSEDQYMTLEKLLIEKNR
ncbi:MULTISPECIES: hypothetical protein [Niallia]|uniref:hypothetical protein n=1 Tax=Niallia TaxID=2837506 RepID=UPI001EDC4C44|nr:MULTISPECIES: hypothetical protein [Niallia]MED4040988.1 hypothetical protein [Niallia taxi]UPO90994.1 hypothetical protein L8T27_027035 [Niallia sp. Man26]